MASKSIRRWLVLLCYEILAILLLLVFSAMPQSPRFLLRIVLRLGKYFGLPAQFWMKLQAEHDLRLAAATAKLERVRVRTAA
jgi:hypothetical protein